MGFANEAPFSGLGGAVDSIIIVVNFMIKSPQRIVDLLAPCSGDFTLFFSLLSSAFNALISSCAFLSAAEEPDASAFFTAKFVVDRDIGAMGVELPGVKHVNATGW